MRFSWTSILALSLAAVVLSGCSSPKMTNTSRSAIEELLLSTATDRAVKKFQAECLSGKKVFVDFANLKSTDQQYVQGRILQHAGAFGAYTVSDKKEADLIVEPFCGALATDHESWLLGLPSITVPIPMAGPVQTPEVAFFKSIEQSATGKLGFRITDRKTGMQIYYELNLLGESYYNRYVLIGIPWNSTDIPGK